MNILTLLLLSTSLAADAFAVSVATGISEKKISLKNALKMSFSFGFFQAMMPILGFFLAGIFFVYIQNFTHWIAFFLLVYIGGNMIREGLNTDASEEKNKNTFSLRSILLLSIATSIDALAVGVSLRATTPDIWSPAIMIGMVTFFLSFLGIEFGKKWGTKIGKRAEIIGGSILILIGFKMLLDHFFR